MAAVREIVEVPGISEQARKAGVPLSAAVRANGLIFVSGTPPIDSRGRGLRERRYRGANGAVLAQSALRVGRGGLVTRTRLYGARLLERAALRRNQRSLRALFSD